MIEEAVILASGYGTRLRPLTYDTPKSMLPVAGRPFITYLLEYAQLYDIQHVVIAVAYLKDVIIDYLGNKWNGIEITYSQHDEPMGTGADLRAALAYTQTDDVLVLNGDTLFNVNLPEYYKKYMAFRADVGIAVKWSEHTNGKHVIVNNKLVRSNGGPGYINGGVYIVNPYSVQVSGCVSFEDDYLARCHNMFVYHSNGEFIDIGTVDDYQLAQRVLPEVVSKWA